MFKGRGVATKKFTQDCSVKGGWGETRKGSRQEVVQKGLVCWSVHSSEHTLCLTNEVGPILFIESFLKYSG